MVKGGTSPVILRGTAKYAKLTNLDKWGKWSCTIYPDQDSMPKVHKLISEGVKNKLRKDDDGYCITFSRPAKIKTKFKGEIELDPVIITDEEDHVLNDRLIMDGEDITMRLETYGGPSGTGFGLYKAARLAQIKKHGTKTSRPMPPF